MGCSTIDHGSDPGEEGMYAETGLEGDGVLVQCGNLEAENYYWEIQVGGVLKVLEMPVVCVGAIDTPGFDYQAAVAVDGLYEFPEVDADIQLQCAAACEAAHHAGTNESPLCLAENFAPNWAIPSWTPSDGPNCDSSILPDIHGPAPLVKTGDVP